MPLKRSGRPKILSPRTESILIRDVKRNCHKTSASISNELKKNMNISISPPTIRKILINNDLRAYKSVKKPLIGKNIAKKRLIFCQKYKEINWNNVIFSDESQFTCNYSNQPPLVRRPKGSSLLPRYLTKTVKFPQSVMIWGCFRGNKLGTLYIVEGSMNSAQYLKVLEKKMLPFYNQDSNSIFQDDSAPCHRSNSVKKWHQDNNIRLLEWPGYSADLNPIKNLWAIMKKKVAMRCP